jgi:hypothetical protein
MGDSHHWKVGSQSGTTDHSHIINSTTSSTSTGSTLFVFVILVVVGGGRAG